MRKEDISFSSTKNIKDYKIILQGLMPDFDTEHWESILAWCGIIDNDAEDTGKYWRVWLIEVQNKTTGICGLYSIEQNDNSELWLGWFGVLKPYRDLGIGAIAMEFMEVEAKKVNCKRILSYVESGGKAIKFYTRQGFREISTCEQYLKTHPESADYLGEPTDMVIQKEIDL